MAITFDLSPIWRKYCDVSPGGNHALEILFRRYLAVEISVRFTVKQLRCELSSSFNITSGSEEGIILFLQIAVTFEMKNKKEGKTKHRVPEFFSQTRRKKTIQNFNNKTSQSAVFFS